MDRKTAMVVRSEFNLEQEKVRLARAKVLVRASTERKLKRLLDIKNPTPVDIENRTRLSTFLEFLDTTEEDLTENDLHSVRLLR